MSGKKMNQPFWEVWEGRTTSPGKVVYRQTLSRLITRLGRWGSEWHGGIRGRDSEEYWQPDCLCVHVPPVPSIGHISQWLSSLLAMSTSFAGGNTSDLGGYLNTSCYLSPHSSKLLRVEANSNEHRCRAMMGWSCCECWSVVMDFHICYRRCDT